jgi:hypothetical protein
VDLILPHLVVEALRYPERSGAKMMEQRGSQNSLGHLAVGVNERFRAVRSTTATVQKKSMPLTPCLCAGSRRAGACSCNLFAQPCNQ